jgi:hypothetical protein
MTTQYLFLKKYQSISPFFFQNVALIYCPCPYVFPIPYNKELDYLLSHMIGMTFDVMTKWLSGSKMLSNKPPKQFELHA